MKTERCEIRIRGMICRSCTDEVSGMLLRTKGVVKATVSYRKAMAVVSYDPVLVTPDDLEKRIKSLGYETGERSRAERLLDLGCAALTALLVWLLLCWGGATASSTRERRNTFARLTFLFPQAFAMPNIAMETKECLRSPTKPRQT